MKSSSIFRTVFLVAVCMAAAVVTPAAAQNPQAGLTGEEVYRTFCLVCHGPRGQGSPLGKSIIDPQSLAYSDEDLRAIITNGRIDQGMAAFGGALTNDEIQGVLVYVRELQGRSAARVQESRQAQTPARDTAIVRRGHEIFTGKANCMQCHSYDFHGGMIGPDLTEVARRLTPEQLREAVANPSAQIADGYAAKVLVTQDGKTVRGVARNETANTVQVLDEEGTIWRTYFKDKLKSVEDLEGSYMPDTFNKLTSDEQEALLAFLETLK